MTTRMPHLNYALLDNPEDLTDQRYKKLQKLEGQVPLETREAAYLAKFPNGDESFPISREAGLGAS